MDHTTLASENIENERAKASMVYREDVAPGLTIEMDLRGILVTTASEYQKVDVIDTYFGKVCEHSLDMEHC